MKIAIYFDLPLGGASRTMEELIKIFREDHEVRIFHNQETPYIFPFAKRIFADMESIFFQKYRQRLQAEEIDQQRFDIVFVSHDRHSQAPWILRFLKTPTVFLCQEPTRAYFEQFLSIDSRLPAINKIYETINRAIRKNIEIKNASFAGRTIANSIYSMESIFRAYGILSTPIYLGIDSKEYFPESVIKKNQVLVIGNHEPQKALLLAIEAVSKVDREQRPALVIASPRDRDSTELRQLAKKLKVNLGLLVGLSQNELRKVYSQSSLTLAVAHLEPFGLSVVESLACGTPVVAVAEGGFRETVIPGITGILVERDSKKVAEAIQSLLQNKELVNKMEENGVRVANEAYTWQKTATKIIKIFHETSRHHR